MALDAAALEQALMRELAATLEQPLHFRLGDEFLPLGTELPVGCRLRCCTCGFGGRVSDEPTACPLCGSRAWEVQPEHTRVLR